MIVLRSGFGFLACTGLGSYALYQGCRALRDTDFSSHFLSNMKEALCQPSVKVAAGVMGIGLGLSYLRKVLVSGSLPHTNKAVLITGCDSGFGYRLAEDLSRKGLKVYAGCFDINGRGPQQLKKLHPKIELLQLNIIKEDEIEQCLKTIQADPIVRNYGLWGLVNNAGSNYLLDIEISKIRYFYDSIETNLLGHIRVTKAFLPLVRRAEGRVLFNTSVKGFIGIPTTAPYTVAKYGLEGFADCLRVEMLRFGVKVSVIRPCNFGGATSMMSISAIAKNQRELTDSWDACSDDVKDAYGREYRDAQVPAWRAGAKTANSNLSLVTNAMQQALLQKEPQPRYFVAGSNRIIFDEYHVSFCLFAAKRAQ